MNRKNLIKKFILLAMSVTLLSLFTACSSQNNDQRIYTLQEVQSGTVVAVKKVVIKAEPVRPHGNVGVSVGSGGHAGLYGAVDVLTLGSLLGIKKKDKVMQEIIIKRPNGTLVAVTQPYSKIFNRGDKVKIIQRGNEARVIH